MQGTYRAGFWYDPQDKERHDGGFKRDDMGFYLSFDQYIYKESHAPDDKQGLGLFARYSFSDGAVNKFRVS